MSFERLYSYRHKIFASVSFMFNKISAPSTWCQGHIFPLWKCNSAHATSDPHPSCNQKCLSWKILPCLSFLTSTLLRVWGFFKLKTISMKKHTPSSVVFYFNGELTSGTLRIWRSSVLYSAQHSSCVLFEHAWTLAFNTFFPLMSLLYNLLFCVQLGLPFLFFALPCCFWLFKFSE